MIEDISPGESSTPTGGADARAHRFEYDRSEPQAISVAIARAVASVSGVDPLSLEPRLYDAVDPDALVRLLTGDSTDGEVRITFPFGSHEVTVAGSGEIVVRTDATASD
ncbi:MAG: HalOD1 output domain-containing protein [Halohasta sp.]